MAFTEPPGYRGSIDWQLFHYLNGSLSHHALIGDEIEDFATLWAVPLFAVTTLSLWLFDRPYRPHRWAPYKPYRWKIACLSGLASAGLGLVLSQVIGHIWARERPFVAHPAQTILLAPPSTEPSFPSDHAVAAFAIAFSVLLVGGRLAGAFFLTGAFIVGITRVFVGLHYPGDIAGGALVALGSALVVYFIGRSRWGPIVEVVSRLTDPVVVRAWGAVDALGRRRRALVGHVSKSV